MLFWDDFFKLPSGSRLVMWNLMVRALQASNFEEHVANRQAEEDAKRRGVPFPHKGPYVPMVIAGLRANVHLYKYRFSVHSKDFFVLIQMGQTNEAGQKRGHVKGWFEAKGDSEITFHVNRIQDCFGD